MQSAARNDSNHREINYEAGRVARLAHLSTAIMKLVWGPLGTAKTTWLCWRFFFLAQYAAEVGISLEGLIVRDTYRNLADSTLKTFLHWFPEGECGYKAKSEPVDYKLRVGGRYHTLIFRHGQTEQDASMFLSREYDFIGLEEIAPAYLPGEKKVSPGIAEGVFDMAISRMTRDKVRARLLGGGGEVAMTCNAPPLTHWASKRIIDKPKSYLDKLNWGHWMFPVSDNMANLRSDYYKNLEMAWEGKRALIQRFIRGERIAVFVGMPRFNIDKLEKMLGTAEDPPFRGYLTPTRANLLNVKLEQNPEGWVKMWKPPTAKGRYIIGADAAAGVEGGDYSSAHVLDKEDLSIAATFHGHLEPSKFADELEKLGNLYNRALVAVETEPSAHGLTTATKLRDTGYPNLHYSSQLDTRSKRSVERIGWINSPGKKPVLIDTLADYLGDGGDVIDKETIQELMTFGIMSNGKLEAQEGCFDDRVISFALAIYVRHHSGMASVFSNWRD